MAIGCKIFWAPKDEAASTEFWTNHLGPLLEKHLAAEEARTGRVADLDVLAFMTLWEQRGMCVVMAYDGDTPVGFLIAFVFRPLFFHCVNMHVERWYGETPEVEKALFAFLTTSANLLGVEELHAAEQNGVPLPEGLDVDDADTYRMVRIKV